MHKQRLRSAIARAGSLVELQPLPAKKHGCYDAAHGGDARCRLRCFRVGDCAVSLWQIWHNGFSHGVMLCVWAAHSDQHGAESVSQGSSVMNILLESVKDLSPVLGHLVSSICFCTLNARATGNIRRTAWHFFSRALRSRRQCKCEV